MIIDNNNHGERRLILKQVETSKLMRTPEQTELLVGNIKHLLRIKYNER